MSELQINTASRAHLDTFIARPMHALLLHGQKGVGLKTIATAYAQKLGDAIIREVNPDEKGTITIESVRGLYALTRTQRDAPLVIIIDDAESMGREAQNALLKLLEEPSRNVYFMLTTHHPQMLLATITSRVQRIEILPITKEASATLLETNLEPALRSQILFLASGLPAEIVRLQTDEAYRAQQIKITKDARAYLEADTYDRLLLSSEYANDRVMILRFLESLSSLLMFMALEKQAVDVISRLEAIDTTRERLGQNAHVKTQLAYLATVF